MALGKILSDLRAEARKLLAPALIKIRKVLKRLRAVGADFRAFVLLRLGSTRHRSGISGFELLAWALAFAATTAGLLNLVAPRTLLKVMEASMDRQDVQYQLASDGEKLYVRPVYAERPPGARPDLLRVDVSFFGTIVGPESRFQGPNFFEFALNRRTGIAIPTDLDPIPSLLLAGDKESVERFIRVESSTPELLADIRRSQDLVHDFLIDETSIGYGFSRVVFRHARVGELGRNTTYLLVLFLVLTFTSMVTLHIAARIAGRRSSFRMALDLGLRIAGMLVLVVALANIFFTPTLVLPWSDAMGYGLAQAGLVLFLVAAVTAVGRSYSASVPRMLLILVIALPISLITGVVIFAPAIAITTKYSDILSLLL